jgi:hypothetical protein
MIYSDLTTALAILAQQYDATGTFTFIKAPNFAAFLPRVIEYAEGRIYREITPLATRSSEASAVTFPGLRTLQLNAFTPEPVVVEGLALIIPAGKTPRDGTRVPYEQVSIDFIDQVWPIEGTLRAPDPTSGEQYWALLDNQTVILAPTPDAQYTVEATGIFRPTPLSAANPSTYLTSFYPDVFVAACMISVSGFQRDYGAQADDPKLAISWESVYQELKGSAMEEEQRRRGQGPEQGNLPPAPESQQRRT